MADWFFDKKTRSIKSNDSHCGVEIRYIKSRKVVAVSGWFDGIVGIEEIEIPLEEFVRLLDLSNLMKEKSTITKKKKEKPSIATILPEPYYRSYNALLKSGKKKMTLEEAKEVLWNTPGIRFWCPVTIEEVLQTLDTFRLIDYDKKNKKVILRQMSEKATTFSRVSMSADESM